LRKERQVTEFRVDVPQPLASMIGMEDYSVELEKVVSRALCWELGQLLPIEMLTERSRKVLLAAKREAGELDHHYIGTEHLLLGLLDEPDGIAAQVLAELGVTDAVKDRLHEIMGSPNYSTRTPFPGRGAG
jgi:hypothetical protein